MLTSESKTKPPSSWAWEISSEEFEGCLFQAKYQRVTSRRLNILKRNAVLSSPAFLPATTEVEATSPSLRQAGKKFCQKEH